MQATKRTVNQQLIHDVFSLVLSNKQESLDAMRRIEVLIEAMDETLGRMYPKGCGETTEIFSKLIAIYALGRMDYAAQGCGI